MFTRFLIAAPIAIAVSAVFVGAAISPAHAAAAANCATTPVQLRTAADAATDVAAQRKALMFISTGEKLCADNAKFEAGQKFAAAAKALKLDLATLPSATASAQ